MINDSDYKKLLIESNIIVRSFKYTVPGLIGKDLVHECIVNNPNENYEFLRNNLTITLNRAYHDNKINTEVQSLVVYHRPVDWKRLDYINEWKANNKPKIATWNKSYYQANKEKLKKIQKINYHKKKKNQSNG